MRRGQESQDQAKDTRATGSGRTCRVSGTTTTPCQVEDASIVIICVERCRHAISHHRHACRTYLCR